MADVNANIGVNIDTSDALNQLKNLQRQISQFHQSVAKSSSTAAVAQRDLQRNFVNGVNAIQGFSAELRTVRTSAESFTNSLEKNKFSIREYFRYAAGATQTFGKSFGAEFSTIEKTAIERVKTLQTQYIKMGRDAQGAMQAIAIRPTVLNMQDLGTQTAITAQKQVLFNQLVKQGSTNLLNFGKNTQWAGRQLMVGFTLPLATLGMTAGRVFMDMEKAAIKFKKVYGDLFTAPEETQRAMDAVTELGLAYTKYGVAVSDSLSVAADAAAAGFQGVDLQNQTTASLKLSVLGQMELQKALETTIALQNAFRISSEELVGTIDFLNAVENQTVVSLDDITEATPRVATVIQALGGDVKDLAFFLAAMKEGGVNAAQGANALKSGLASLINPTERASDMLLGMGVNIRAIVSENQGDLKGTIVEFAQALDTLDPMNRARAIEQLFGKFQFARMSALFDNVIRDGSQASRVLDLAQASMSELATLSEKELGVQAASAMNKFTSAIERIKVALVPLGELFLEIATPFIDFGTKVLEAFNNLPEEMKKIIGTVVTVVGGLGPILLMTFGLINNGIANMIKFFATVRLGYLKMTGQAKGIGDETQYMTTEQLEAAAAAASLDQAHSNLTQRFTAEKVAVDALRTAYEQAAAAGARFASINPGMMKPGFAPTKMAKGGVVTVGGRGNKDTEPALLTPGEAVIPAEMVKKYQPLIQGMIAGNIPGYANGVMLGMPKSAKSVSKSREAAQQVYEMFLKSSYANTAPTEYGHQISPTSGHSFPIFGLGGVYQKGDKQVFVKPVLDEKAALAEMRSTEISRRAHGLEAPQQRIVVIRDPMDTTRQRRFLALESDLDPKFVNNQPMGVFNEEQYFRQLVASLLRVDKDLSGSNVYGNVVADAGPSGVFSRASGLRDYEKNLPSMEEQAIINLLGIKGGAKRAFAESTLGLMAGLNPEQYRQRMIGEIQKVLPRLKETIASFKLTNPTEVGVYDDMIRRLEQGLGVDWSKFHAVHSAVKIPKPKAGTQAAPLGLANGIVSVPGPKGAGDVVAAMLSPGEAVIPAEMAKKYASLINAMIAGNIPGYSVGKPANFGQKGEVPLEASHVGSLVPRGALATLRAILELEPKYKSMIETVFLMEETLADGTTAVRKYQMSWEEMANLPDNSEIVSGGYSAPGTTVLETKERNQAYSFADIPGAPETLQEQIDAAEKSRIALEANTRQSEEYGDVYRQLIEEGRVALELKQTENANQHDVNRTLEVYTDVYSQGAIATSRASDLEDGKALALKALAPLQQKYNQEISEGISHEDALNNLKLRAIAIAKSEVSTGESAVGGPGTGGQQLRGIASGRGDSRVTRVDMQEEETRRFAARGREGKDVASRIYNSVFKDAKEFSVEAAKGLFSGIRSGLRINSPSQEIADIAQSVTDGVDSVKPEAEKAGQRLANTTTQAMKNASGSAFGNINTKEPVPAVGNAPREVTAAMQKESTAARTFAGDIKASFANVRSNLAREMGFVKEEFASIVQQIKQRFNIGGKEIVAVAQQTNQGLVINGKNYAVNAIAQAQGRDGAIEAILTKKNAEILSKIAATYNSGAIQIPRVIAKGIEGQDAFLGLVGGGIATEIAKGSLKAARDLSGTVAAAAPAPFVQNDRAGKLSAGLSQFSFGLSSASGLLAVFGQDLNGIMPIVSGVSAGLFTLSSISQMLVGTKIAEIAATRLLTAAKTQGAVGEIAQAIATNNVATMFGTMFVKGRGLVGFFINMGKVVLTLAKSFGLIGLAITALSFGIPMILDALKKHEQKVSGLGDAAFVAGEKLKAIANVIGFEPTRDPKTSVGQAADFTGATDEVVSGAIDVRQTESFKALIADGGAYKADLEAIKNASVADAQVALNTLITQLIATAPKDFDPAKIQQFAAAIATEAGKTDLDLSLGVSLNPFEAGNADKVIAMANDMAKNVIDQQAVDLTAVRTHTAMFGVEITQFRGMNGELTAAANNQAASLSAFYEQLKTGLMNGVITSEEYVDKTEELLGTLSSFPEVYSMEVLSQMLQGVGIDPSQVNNIKNLNDKLLVTNALLTKGATINKEDIDAIASGDRDKAAKARLNIEKEVNRANLATADSVAKLKKVEEGLENTRQASALEEYLEKAREEAALKVELEAAGYSAADAQLILSNEMLKGAYATAVANGTLEEYNKQLAEFKAIEGTLGRGGGAAQQSPFEQATESLTKQRDEIKSNINAYAKLRNAGFGVSEASDLAADSTLALALANEKVGSKKYNELISKIKQVKKAQEELGETDPRVGTEQYNEAVGKLNAYFDSQEALMDAANESATKANRALIETLEDQIEGYNRQIGAFERDLDKIAEKEDAINKAYNEKTKALETVKKLNQDIINQQKSQLSIANALSQGDVSAAASAIQDARAQNAAAQGDIQGRALEAGRDAQIGAIREGGLSRAQIEEKIKGLKKNISDIEIGSLRTAQDAVKAADDANEKAKSLLSFKQQTREQWRLEALQVEGAKAKAELYEKGVGKALGKATSLVAQWGKLNGTFTTTHVINEIRNTSGGTSGKVDPKAPVVPSFSGGGKGFQFLAGGGMVKPAFFAKGGFAKGTDTVPAMLTPGEFVINRAESEKFAPLLHSINDGSMSRGLKTYSTPVYNMPERNYAPQGPSGLGYSAPGKSESSTAIDNSVYNYNLSVKVEGSNLNANDVANQVMNKIKQVDAQRMRNQVIR